MTTGMGPNAAVPDEVKAHRFALVDGDGKDRGGLDVGKDGPSLALDFTAKNGVSLSLTDMGPALSLNGNKGNALLTFTETGPMLVLRNNKGKTILNSTETGPVLTLGGENGKCGVTLQGDERRSGLGIWDKNGKNRAALSINENGLPGLHLCDENGKNRDVLGVNENGLPALLLYDENGILRAGLVIDPKSKTPRLGLFDENGRWFRGLP